MTNSRTFLLLAAVLALSHLSLGEEIECYSCIGYDSSKDVNTGTNNPDCPTGSFNQDKVNTEHTKPLDPAPFCYTLTIEGYNRTLTFRGPSIPNEGLVSTKDIRGNINGYYCNVNLCNASSLPTIFLPAVLLLLGLTRLLA